MKYPIPYRRRRNEAPSGLDRSSQPYSNAVGIAKWLVEGCRKTSMPLGMRHIEASYRVPKGTLATHHMNPSHFAVPTARLYGWLPLSDAYGIGCMAGYPYLMPTARLYGWLPLSDAYGIGCAKGGKP